MVLVGTRIQDADKDDWYIWSDTPNNWTSAFGGSAWTYSSRRDAYYLHTFANLSQISIGQIQKCVRPYYRFSDFGMRRVSMVFDWMSSMHTVKTWHFGTIQGAKIRLGFCGGFFYGYIGQEHIYDRDRPELLSVLKEFRALADEYDAVLIGETLDERFEYSLANPMLVMINCIWHLTFLPPRQVETNYRRRFATVVYVG